MKKTHLLALVLFCIATFGHLTTAAVAQQKIPESCLGPETQEIDLTTSEAGVPDPDERDLHEISTSYGPVTVEYRRSDAVRYAHLRGQLISKKVEKGATAFVFKPILDRCKEKEAIKEATAAGLEKTGYYFFEVVFN